MTSADSDFNKLLKGSTNYQAELPNVGRVKDVFTTGSEHISNKSPSAQHTINARRFFGGGAILTKIPAFTNLQTNEQKPSNKAATPKDYDAQTMTDHVSKDLLDAKLEAIEARMDSRVAGMSSKLDATLAELKADRQRFTHIEAAVAEIKTNLKQSVEQFDRRLEANLKQTDDRVAGLKSNIWLGVVTTIAAVGTTLGIAVAAFDSGRETSKNISEATARMEKLQAQLEASARVQTAVQAQPPASTASGQRR